MPCTEKLRWQGLDRSAAVTGVSVLCYRALQCFMEPLKKVQVEGHLMFAEPQDLFGNLDELCYVCLRCCFVATVLYLVKTSVCQFFSTDCYAYGIVTLLLVLNWRNYRRKTISAFSRPWPLTFQWVPWPWPRPLKGQFIFRSLVLSTVSLHVCTKFEMSSFIHTRYRRVVLNLSKLITWPCPWPLRVIYLSRASTCHSSATYQLWSV